MGTWTLGVKDVQPMLRAVTQAVKIPTTEGLCGDIHRRLMLEPTRSEEGVWEIARN